jgi:poly(3-hydroxybutyrate) depolymerase
MKRVLVFVFLFATCANAEVLDKSAVFAKMKVDYRVVLPQGYDAARAYPAVLAFVGGGQTLQMVRNEVDRTWKPEAERRGYIVVMPAAPDGQLFFQGGDRVFPQFIEQLLKDYKVEGGKFHIAGHSNGGISAFHIAGQYPQYFRTITGFPGYLPEDGNASIDRIKPMCIFLHVGQRDLSWQGEMEGQMERFKQRGLRVQFHIEPNEDHLIQALQGAGVKRLFDQFESCK